ncbi:hypothetical protein CEXT_490511 [Caerostris extrusa]|uniref:Transmembrane protein n=1 Tax=Caerostris extrusa TaxID=172846 RepID=A0AAV4XW75_CAEEX|nr:hypothetical protein CEXT_490511 [Caerostris extrusa]
MTEAYCWKRCIVRKAVSNSTLPVQCPLKQSQEKHRQKLLTGRNRLSLGKSSCDWKTTSFQRMFRSGKRTRSFLLIREENTVFPFFFVLFFWGRIPLIPMVSILSFWVSKRKRKEKEVKLFPLS